MKSTHQITHFKGLLSSRSAQFGSGYASDCLNVRVSGGDLSPRFGFRFVSHRPSNFTGSHGFSYLAGYNDNYEFREEILAIESRNGVPTPVSIHARTGHRTVITHKGMPVQLEAKPHLAFTFGGSGYVIAPDSTKTLYKHEIGNQDHFEQLQDSNYVPPPADPELRITALPPSTRPWESGDTWTFTQSRLCATVPTATFETGAGTVTLKSYDRSSRFPGQITMSVSFAAPVDASASDYVFIEVVGGVILGTFHLVPPRIQLKSGGTWSGVLPEADTAVRVSQDGHRYLIGIYLGGQASTNAIEGIRFSLQGTVTRDDSGVTVPVFSIKPLIYGGVQLFAKQSTDRIWEPTTQSEDIHYAVRFTNNTGASAASFSQITPEMASGFQLSEYGVRAGAQIRLGVDLDDSSTYNSVQFYRKLVGENTWKQIATVPNALQGSETDLSFVDPFCEYELATLPTVSDLDTPSIQPKPAFSTQGLVGAIPFKGRVVWLFKGGSKNVRHSRTGDPEELYAENAAYDPEDLTQPADYSLAENFGDEPLGGVAASEAIIILGRRAAYSHGGDYAHRMTPCRQIPGSNGAAGRFAFARFKPNDGAYGCAYLDGYGNVWFVQQQAAFQSDSASRPIELSEPIRGDVIPFLVDAQKQEFGYESLEQAQVHVDNSDGALWIVMGRRALVLRLAEKGDAMHWEKYEFATHVPAESSTTQNCTPFAFGIEPAESIARMPNSVNFQTPNAVFLSDDVYAVAQLDVDQKSDMLRALKMPPSPTLSNDATIDSVRIRAEVSKLGQGWAECDSAYLLLNGERLGSNLTVGGELAPEDTPIVLEFSPAASVSASQLNQGEVGFELGFAADPVPLSTYNDPANWQWTISPSGPQVAQGGTSQSLVTVFSITVRFVGSTPTPKRVVVRVVGTAEGRGYIPPENPTGYTGDVWLDTGLNAVLNAPIQGLQTGNIPVERTVTGSKDFVVDLVNGVGSVDVTMSSEVTLVNGLGNAQIVHRIDGFQAIKPSPAQIRVDSLALSACFTAVSSRPAQNEGVAINLATFGPGNRKWCLSSGGPIFEFEYDSLCRKTINGIRRDAGLEMPTGFWKSHPISEAFHRVSNVIIQRTPISVEMDAELFSPKGLIAAASSPPNKTYARFGIHATASNSSLKFWVNEQVNQLQKVNTEIVHLSSRYRD